MCMAFILFVLQRAPLLTCYHLEFVTEGRGAGTIATEAFSQMCCNAGVGKWQLHTVQLRGEQLSLG